MVKGRELWGVAAFCLLSGSGWVLTQAWPSELGWPFAACIHFGLIGCVGAGVAAVRGEFREPSGRRMLIAGGVGVCLLAVPAAVLQFTGGKISEATTAAVFCAVPLMTVVAAGAFRGEESRVRGLMSPAVAGLSGAAVLFPVSDPGSPRRWLYVGLVAAACVAVAVASVWMHRLTQRIGLAAAVAAVGVACALMPGLYGIAAGWPAMGFRTVSSEALRCVVLDLPSVWLLVWLMREMSPSRLSARFLLVPLVTVLEGYVVERGGMGWRGVLGAGLLCAGGVMLLLKHEPEEIPGLQLR